MSRKSFFSPSRRLLNGMIEGAIVLLLVGALVLFVMSSLRIPQVGGGSTVATGKIVVQYGTPLQKIDPLAMGMDVSGYFTPNTFGNDPVEQQRLKMLGMKYMRMHLMYTLPGDPTSALVCGAVGCDTAISGDQWINAIKSIGAEPVVVVGAGSARDAANIVRHFNIETRNPVHFWIIGNEPDLNGDSAQSYSAAFNQDAAAMKAVDATIKIGGGTTAWYDRAWLQQFLRLAGQQVDFVDFHNYAQQGTTPGDPAGLFQEAQAYGKDLKDLQAMIQATVPARESQITTQVGEWELNWGGDAQNDSNFHALWVASALGNILQAGGKALFFADKGNLLYGSSRTIIDTTGHTVSVQLDDTNAAYHGIGMFTGEGLFQPFGTVMAQASTTLPNVEVFASNNPKNIVVINEDPGVTQAVSFSLAGVPAGAVEVWQKSEAVLFPDPPVHLADISIQNGVFSASLPPFSVTTFVINTIAKDTITPLPPFPSVLWLSMGLVVFWRGYRAWRIRRKRAG
jgi:hypothetical protein